MRSERELYQRARVLRLRGVRSAAGTRPGRLLLGRSTPQRLLWLLLELDSADRPNHPNWKASWDIELNQAFVGWTWSYLASYFRCVRGS